MAKALPKPRFDFIGKTKTNFEGITILSEKVGQRDVKPAIALSLKTSQPNSVLNKFDRTLLAFLYENTGKNTGGLEGIQVVSDVPNLTNAAVRLGDQNWTYEQTGCTLNIWDGIEDMPAIVLRSGTVKKVQFKCNEGGTVDVFWQFYTADVDDETIGHLAVLKSLEREIEMILPELMNDKQKTIDTGDGDLLGAKSPEAALADAEAAAAGKKK